jgi:hypothetical protein
VIPIFIHARRGLCALAALTLVGCAQGHLVKVKAASNVPFEAARPGDAWTRAEKLWSERQDAKKAWASLVAFRAAAEEQPEAPEMWTRYAHACYFLATYTEQNQKWSNPERSKGLYLEGARAAEKALRLNPVYAEKYAQSADEGVATAALGGAWMEPAFWLAANRGRWALGEGRRSRMDGRDRFGGFVRGVARRNPGVYYGGPDRFLGVMFVAAPEPRLDSARAHFDRAQAAGPLFFGNFTLRAEYLAVMEKDSTAFRALLERVLSLPADTLPSAAIENAFEQARARDLLARQAELFR